MTDVFVSYSRKDNAFTRRVVSALEAAQLQVWVDWDGIPLSEDWWSAIRAGITAGEAFAVMVTPSSLASPVCALEIAHALELGKRLIPILHIPADETTSLKALETAALTDNLRLMLKGRDLVTIGRANWLAISQRNWVYLREDDPFEGQIAGLIAAIRTDLAHVKAHTRLLIRAREWQVNPSDSGLLLSGEDLRVAENWLNFNREKDPPPTALHEEYIAASLANQAKLQAEAEAARQRELTLTQRGLRRLQQLVGVLVTSLIVAAGLTAFALNQRDQVIARNDALSSIALAGAAQDALADGRPDTALALAVRANQYPTVQPVAVNALAFALGESRIVGRDHLSDSPILSADLCATVNSDRIIMGNADGEVIRIEGNVGRAAQRAKLHNGPVMAIRCVVNIPDTAGNIFYSASLDGTIRRFTWPIDSAAPVVDSTLSFADEQITALAVSDDGAQVIAGFNTGRVRLIQWVGTDSETNTDKPQQTILEYTAPGTVYALAIRPGYPHQVLVAGADRTGSYAQAVALLDLNSGSVLRYFAGHTGFIRAAIFSPDGSALYTAGRDLRVIRWNVETGQAVRVYTRSGGAFNSVALSPDGRTLYAAVTDRRIAVWDAQSGVLLRSLEGHTQAVDTLLFTRTFERTDIPVLISTGDDGDVISWTQNEAEYGRFTGHSGVVRALAIVNRDTILSAGEDGTLRWTDTSGDRTLCVMRGHTGRVVSVAAYGILAASGGEDGSLILWNTDPRSGSACQIVARYDRAKNASGDPGFHTNTVTALDFSPDGKLLASVSSGRNSLNVRDMQTGKIIFAADAHTNTVTSVHFSPDGRYLLTTGADNIGLIWDMQSGSATYSKSVARLTGAGGVVWDGVFMTDSTPGNSSSLDRLRMATVSADGIVRLYDFKPASAYTDVQDLVPVELVGHQAAIKAIIYDRDRLITADESGAILIWNVQTATLQQTLFGHSGTIWDLVLSDGIDSRINDRAGIQFYSAGADGAIIAWRQSPVNVANSLQAIATFPGYAPRYLPDLTCDQRAQFSLEPGCNNGVPPPSPTLNPQSTPNYGLANEITVTPAASYTPYLVPSYTALPAATLTLAPTLTPMMTLIATLPTTLTPQTIQATAATVTSTTATTEVTLTPSASAYPATIGALKLTDSVSIDDPIAIYADSANLVAPGEMVMQLVYSDVAGQQLFIVVGESPFVDLAEWADANTMTLDNGLRSVDGVQVYSVDPDRKIQVFIAHGTFYAILNNAVSGAFSESVQDAVIQALAG